MANICIVDNIFYVLHAEDVPALEGFRNYLCDVVKSIEKRNQSPLGQMFMDKEEPIDNFSISLRDDFESSDIGEIESYCKSGAKFALQESTAWRPCDVAWGIVLKHFPGVHQAYVGFEPAARVFVKHDPDSLFQNRQHIVFTEVEPDAVVPYGMELGNDDELLNFLKETFKLTGDYTVKDLPEVQDMCKKLAEQMGTYLEITSYDIV